MHKRTSRDIQRKRNMRKNESRREHEKQYRASLAAEAVKTAAPVEAQPEPTPAE